MSLPTCAAAGAKFLHTSSGELSMRCGSSWEVDLRSDADCDQPGLERCHPRFTLGWQRYEINLYRGPQRLPDVEYVHSYCDVWQQGRLENVHVAPREKEEARERSLQRRAELVAAPASGALVDDGPRASAHRPRRSVGAAVAGQACRNVPA